AADEAARCIFWNFRRAAHTLERMAESGRAWRAGAQACRVFSRSTSSLFGDLFDPSARRRFSEVLVLDGIVCTSLRVGNDSVAGAAPFREPHGATERAC